MERADWKSTSSSSLFSERAETAVVGLPGSTGLAAARTTAGRCAGSGTQASSTVSKLYAAGSAFAAIQGRSAFSHSFGAVAKTFLKSAYLAAALPAARLLQHAARHGR